MELRTYCANCLCDITVDNAIITKDERGTAVWQCPVCRSYNLVDEPIKYDDIYEFDCDKCKFHYTEECNEDKCEEGFETFTGGQQ